MPHVSKLPGAGGLPLVGETGPFLSDPEGFLDARLRQHGPLFRTHLLSHPTLICASYRHALSLLRADLDASPAYAPFLTPVYPQPNILTAPRGHAAQLAHRRMRAALSEPRLRQYERGVFGAVDAGIDGVLARVRARGPRGLRLAPYEAFKPVAERAMTRLVLGELGEERYAALRRLCSDQLNGVVALPVSGWLFKGGARARGEAGYRGVRDVVRAVVRERAAREEADVECVVDALRGEEEADVVEFGVLLLSAVVAKSLASLGAEAAKRLWRDGGDVDCVMMECARLFPPIMGGMRGGGGAVGEVEVGEMWRAWYSIRHANRDAHAYGDGDDFRAERWRDGRRREARGCPFAEPGEGSGTPTPLSFGGGARHCPGRDATWWVVRRAVARLVGGASVLRGGRGERKEKLFPVLREVGEEAVVLVAVECGGGAVSAGCKEM